MQNVEQVIISQFANSPRTVQLIGFMNRWFSASANLENFYNLIWNIETAEGYGLDVWGRIVGVGRVLEISNSSWLGFEEAGDATVETPFNVAPFYAGAGTTNNFALTDAAYLQLILAKAAYNITDGSIPAINAILMTLFGASGQCWCTDGQNMTMTMTYTFDFTPSPVQLAIIEQSGVLPRPPGVSALVVILAEGLANDGGVLQLASNVTGWPYSDAGLSVGALWNNNWVVCVSGTTTPSGTAAPVFYNDITAASLLALGGANLPLTNPGAGTGQLWNNNGVVCVA